jgi:hypothetical protein
MIPRFHRTILILLLLMLPVQGAVAASRWVCFGHGAAAVSSSHHAHASVGHAHHPDSVHDLSSDSEVAHGSDAPISHDTSGTCHLCAACCLTGAAPPPPFVLSSLPPANAGFPPVSVPVPHNVADGPERPPRTV